MESVNFGDTFATRTNLFAKAKAGNLRPSVTCKQGAAHVHFFTTSFEAFGASYPRSDRRGRVRAFAQREFSCPRGRRSSPVFWEPGNLGTWPLGARSHYKKKG